MALAALLAIAVAAPAAAQADPTLSVDKTTGLSSLVPTDVTVEGEGATFASPGVYVAQTAIVEGEVLTGSARWICAPSAPPCPPAGVVLMNPDGTFETTLSIKPTFTVGDTTVDCAEVQCSVSTWAAHTVPIPTGDTPDPEATPPESPILDSVDLAFAHLAASPTGSLSGSQPTTVEIDGEGITPGMPGVYVAQTAIVEGQVLTGGAQWVCPSSPPCTATLNGDGTFSTTLELDPTFTVGDTTVDCTVVQCSISTWRAHTVPIPADATPDPEASPPQSPILDSIPLGFADLEVTPTSGLSLANPTTVSVTGDGIAAGMPGVYVAQTAIVEGQVYTGDAQWVCPSSPPCTATLNGDGTFSTTLDVKASFTDGDTTVDCTRVTCYVSTWRAHTVPIPADATPDPGASPPQSPLLASVALSFATPDPGPGPKPDPTPDPKPDPPAKDAAKVAAFKKAQKVNGKRIAKVAQVRCAAEKRCKLTAPKRVRIKIGKKTFRAKVLAPKGIGAGKRGLVRVQLTKAARKLLAKRSGASGQLRIRIESDGAKTYTQTVKIKLAGGKKRKK